MIGSTLSHFRITAKLGQGGMGEVYRAEDTRLGREVAIKVLPEAVSQDPERLARFEREAKVLASLNHPHIAAIYSIESATPSKSGPVHFLVMELAQGEDLSARIARGPVPLDEVSPIALQIAEALEAAHERGIIHRDLKPQNIKLTPDGQVKVLDFGLAKALDPASDDFGSSTLSPHSPAVLSMSPTLTQGMTTAGVILGTAAYMSPEQAKGRAVDKRADIWAFGVVLYEMLVGEKLFESETLPETLGAIFRQEIDLEELPAATPPRLRRLLERCLERDPKQRLRDIGEARIALTDPIDSDASPPPATPDSASSRRISPILFVLALVAVAAAAMTIGLRIRPKLELNPPEVTEFSFWVDELEGFVVSPDGRRIAWSSGPKILYRDLSDREPRVVIEDPSVRFAFFSFDGQELAIQLGGQLWRFDLASGGRDLICDLPELPNIPGPGLLDAVWRDDGTIVFAAWRGGIYTVSARGGVPELLVPIEPDNDVDFHSIVVLPDGNSMILRAHYQEDNTAHDGARGGLELVRRSERTRIEIPESLGEVEPAAVLGDRLILRQRSETTSSLWAVPFDQDSGQLDGEPERLLSRIGGTAVADDGTVVYLTPRETPGIVIQLDPSGNEIRRLGEPENNLRTPVLSPDGTRLAFTVDRDELWVRDLVRGTMTRLASNEEDYIEDPQWTPDGRSIVYCLGSGGKILSVRADPGAKAETLTEDAYRAFLAPDGSGLLINKSGFRLDKGGGLYWYPFTEDGIGEGRLVVDGFSINGRLSPDHRLVAYSDSESGALESFLTTFPDADQTLQLSSGGGGTPRWSPDSSRVYYLARESLIEVEVGFDNQGRLRASPEKELFRLEEAGVENAGWDVTPDGNGFLFIKSLESDNRSEIVVARHALMKLED